MFVCVTGSESVYVSKALQKAKIEVNEDGTKASAATSTLLSHESSVFKLFTLSLDVQQDPSSVLMTLICMYSLSHFSCNLARPIFSSVGDCGQTVPVSHQTQSHRYTHVQSIGFLLVYETVILKCS